MRAAASNTLPSAVTREQPSEEPSGADGAGEEDDGYVLSEVDESFETKLLREAIARASALDEKPPEAERLRWSKVKEKLRPTQSALGYDWCFYKLKNFTSETAAQRYMDSKARHWPSSCGSAPGARLPLSFRSRCLTCRWARTSTWLTTTTRWPRWSSSATARARTW